MKSRRGMSGTLAILLASLALVLAFSLACAAAEDTPTPVPPATPAPPVAPTVAPAPTATLVPGAPTPVPVLPTPTRILPTATPVATGEPVYGGIMRMTADLDNLTLDPHVDNGTWGRPVLYAIFNTVVQYDSDFNIIPDVARSWEFSADGKTVTFHTQPGAKFQDGTPLDAEAVKWSLDRVMNPEAGIVYRTNIAPFVDSVELIDKDTFIIHMPRPFRPLLATLGDRPGYVVPKSQAPIPAGEYVQGSAATGFAAQPVGSGPFKLKEWLPGSHIKLERWDGYWEEGKPYLDGILFQEVTEESSRFAMIRTGETDLVEVRSVDLPIIKDDPNINVVPHESGRWMGHVLVGDVPPWNNKALRQAFAYSMNRQIIIDVYLAGAGRLAYISETIGFAYNPDIKPITFDLEKARQKMVEAGFPNGVDVDYYCTSTSDYLRLCEMYQAMAAEADIRVNIKPIPSREYGPGLVNRTVTNRPTSWRPRADPDGRLRLLFHSEGGRGQTMYGWSDPRVDQLLDEAVAIYDTAKAAPLYWEAQRIIAEEAAWIILASTTNYAALNAKVQNFAWIPDFQWRLRDLWIEK